MSLAVASQRCPGLNGNPLPWSPGWRPLSPVRQGMWQLPGLSQKCSIQGSLLAVVVQVAGSSASASSAGAAASASPAGAAASADAAGLAAAAAG